MGLTLAVYSYCLTARLIKALAYVALYSKFLVFFLFRWLSRSFAVILVVFCHTLHSLPPRQHGTAVRRVERKCAVSYYALDPRFIYLPFWVCWCSVCREALCCCICVSLQTRHDGMVQHVRLPCNWRSHQRKASLVPASALNVFTGTALT